jgi:hypothetical protein
MRAIEGAIPVTLRVNRTAHPITPNKWQADHRVRLRRDARDPRSV